VWLARETEIRTPVEGEPAQRVVREVTFATQEAAEARVREWTKAFESEAKAAQRIAPPPRLAQPPSNADASDARINQFDKQTFDEARREALRKLWPRTLPLLEAGNVDSGKASDANESLRLAWRLDAAERTGERFTDIFPAPGPSDFRAAMNRALDVSRRRRVRNELLLADSVIATCWSLGWCYLSSAQLAESLNRAIGKELLTPQSARKRASRLGLYSKSLEGRPPTSA
jgi:hypothetical protein